jgi:hypothetical protein
LCVRDTPSGGRRGGYLLTTEYGRPLEFHYTTEVRFRGPQRVLYGAASGRRLDVELFALPLVDRQFAPPQIVFVDDEWLLGLRESTPAPVVALIECDAVGCEPWQALVHDRHRHDLSAFEAVRTLCPPSFDWLEPFARLTEALAELRDPRAAAA